jgi:membrane protein Man1
LNSLCGKKGLQGSNCVTEQEKIQRLYNVLISQVQDKYLKSQCDNSDIIPTINIQTLYEYISTHENIPPREIEELVELFKSIAKTYSDSPIGYDNSFKINTPPNLPFMCAAKNIFSNMFYLTTWLGIGMYIKYCMLCIFFKYKKWILLYNKVFFFYNNLFKVLNCEDCVINLKLNLKLY